MNLLAVDIGNTDIKFGVFRDDKLVRFWRSSGTRTQPERFSSQLRNTLAEQGVNFDALVYCTVVPDVEAVLVKTIRYCYQLKYPILAVDPRTTRLPVQVEDYPLDQLGTDRLVNACGAHYLYPEQPVIIVDFGTATTLDVVTAEGVFIGGAITPGLKSFSEILTRKTSLPGNFSIHNCKKALGHNTAECLQSGIGIGYRGIIKELLHKIRQEFPIDDQSRILNLATGGLAESFSQICPQEPLFRVYEPSLTLKGLWAIYQYNRQLVSAPSA